MKKDELEKKLIDEQNLLVMELKQLGRIVDSATGDWEAVPPPGLPEADENDLADRNQGFEERTAMLNTLEARLKDVNDALAHMKANTFGICEVCGKKIEEARLSANPAARTCMMHMNQS